MLQPLIDNVHVREHRGRYRIQLEIPEGSTLTSGEIDKVLAVSSWDVDPNTEAAGYEGSRAVLLNRERPTRRGPFELKGLQLSGIGYKRFIMGQDLATTSDEPFRPPTTDNFMDVMTGTKMGTSYAQGRRVVHTTPAYRAAGTYLLPELRDKVIKTVEVSRMQFDGLVVPNVEAYGRYLDPEMRNQEGEFGFAVFPIPDPKIPRVTHKSLQMYAKQILEGGGRYTEQELMLFYHVITSSHLLPMILALREMHDKVRIVHLQPHSSNYYLVDGIPIPYVMDWSTMRRLGQDREENLINRAIDMRRPADDYVHMLRSILGDMSQDFTDMVTAHTLSMVMEMYSNNPGEEVDPAAVSRRAFSIHGRQAEDLEIVLQWMKDQGFEGFPKHEPKRDVVAIDIDLPLVGLEHSIGFPIQSSTLTSKKIGRNNPCPCGSGAKFKKCCGGH